MMRREGGKGSRGGVVAAKRSRCGSSANVCDILLQVTGTLRPRWYEYIRLISNLV